MSPVTLADLAKIRTGRFLCYPSLFVDSGAERGKESTERVWTGSVFVCAYESEREKEKERESVCVCVRKRMCVCVCVCVCV